MNWAESIDLYCERTDASFGSEPLNALTNLAFVAAALWLVRRYGRTAPRDACGLIALTALLFSGAQVSELSSQSCPVGTFDDTSFATATVPLPPGSQMLLYSDGVFELPLDDGGQWSAAKLPAGWARPPRATASARRGRHQPRHPPRWLHPLPRGQRGRRAAANKTRAQRLRWPDERLEPLCG